MIIRIEEVIKNVFHVNFPNQLELTSTFLRFQEHYESPKFANQYFSLDEFKDWYINTDGSGLDRNEKNGEFTYYEDWTGFNIPSHILEPFRDGYFDPLSQKEKSFLALFKSHSMRRWPEKYYIIGTYGDDVDTLKHEIAHGLFYTVPEYKAEVLEALQNLKATTRVKIETHLIDGYYKDSLVDETHAYVLENLKYLEDEGIVGDDVIKTSEVLNEIYERYLSLASNRTPV